MRLVKDQSPLLQNLIDDNSHRLHFRGWGRVHFLKQPLLRLRISGPQASHLRSSDWNLPAWLERWWLSGLILWGENWIPSRDVRLCWTVWPPSDLSLLVLLWETQRETMLTFISSLTCQRPSGSFRRFAEVVNGPGNLEICRQWGTFWRFPSASVNLFDALVQCGVVVFGFGLLSLEIIVTVLALTSPGGGRRFPKTN